MQELSLKRLVIYSPVWFIVLLGCTPGDTPLTESEQDEARRQVSDSFDRLVAASKSFDFDRYLAFFDKDKFSGLNGNGTVTHSLADFERIYRPQFSVPQSYESLDFNKVKITIINRTTAILVNEFHARVLLKTGEVVPAAGGGTQVWSKSSGVWKLVNVSSSARPHEPDIS